MIFSQGVENGITPKFRRYHEGRFFKFNAEGIKNQYKEFMKPIDPDYFKGRYVPEDTDHTKNFKWNDIEGMYDPKGWDPAPWEL